MIGVQVRGRRRTGPGLGSAIGMALNLAAPGAGTVYDAAGAARDAHNAQKQQARPIARVGGTATETVDVEPKHSVLPWVIGGGTLLLVGAIVLIVANRRS